jgi:hypothetical protein
VSAPGTHDPLAQLVAPPVFVVGQHRSGTTWVFDLLTHPDDVAGVFESWLFTQNHGLGGILHWTQWDEEQSATAQRITGRPSGIQQLVDRDEVRQIARDLATRWLARALKPSDRYLVEKSPDHLQAALEIDDVFPDARFISVIRDGRDVAVSQRAAHSWAPSFITKRRTSPLQVAHRWREIVEMSARLSEHFGPRFMEISYEELHRDPKAAATTLFRFCGFDHDAAEIEAALGGTRIEKQRKSDDDPFRRAGRTGDWRSTFSVLDRLAFERAAGPALRARGYESSRWWWLRRTRAGA